jgi:hypothetical protein
MSPWRRTSAVAATSVLTLSLLLAGCSGDSDRGGGPPNAPSGAPTSDDASGGTGDPSSPTNGPTDEETSETDEPIELPVDVPGPPVFDTARAMRTVRHLAVRIGPREGSSDAFADAADWVEGQFAALGYDVHRQRFRVPAGNSWGVDVPAGTSVNVVADPPGLDPSAPHVVVGAHLDTVPVAPGAEDNASGVAVVLELSRLAAMQERDLPVRFVAFGAEEPRGEGDAMHHFGSTHYVEQMTRLERRALVAMVSLDRVGVRGPFVPVCSGPGGDVGIRDQLAASARAQGIEVQLCDDSTTSDHWSFTKAGLPSARLGSIDYTEYHTEADVPSVVDATQLARVGRTTWHWLNRR